jgi:hypothetical protein
MRPESCRAVAAAVGDDFTGCYEERVLPQLFASTPEMLLIASEPPFWPCSHGIFLAASFTHSPIVYRVRITKKEGSENTSLSTT